MSLKGNRREDDLLRRIRDAQGGASLRIAPSHRLAGVVADPPERLLRLVRRKDQTLVTALINNASEGGGAKAIVVRRNGGSWCGSVLRDVQVRGGEWCFFEECETDKDEGAGAGEAQAQ